MSEQVNKTTADVQDYYGKVLQSKDDLKTSACCTADGTPAHIRPLLKNIHDEVQMKFYGCGTPVPTKLEGCTVLDLGCGTGRDVYLLSQMVGENGAVIGLDMTDEQLDVASKYQEWHAEKFGYAKPNTRFVKGYMEDLKAAKIKDESIDVIISNCVFNLSPDKPAVFKEAFRVLKSGGELFFSDVFSDQRISSELQADPVLFGECLSGALYMEDFATLMKEIGYSQYRIISQTTFDINNAEIEKKIGHINFTSITLRVIKTNPDDAWGNNDPYGCETKPSSGGCC